MEGDASVYHTVAACSFESAEHIEHWINKLVPKDRNGEFVKWSGGRRKRETRNKFIANCLRFASEIDFRINCVSTNEGEMSWFAWAFYMQNQRYVSQRLDAKGRNCLVFKTTTEDELPFPVLRAGYLIWYHHVIRYLAESQGVKGKLLSDNFANDQEGPGEGKALAVSFVNFLLAQSNSDLLVSLPVTARYRAYDRLSDYFCGWVNSVRSNSADERQAQELATLEAQPRKFIDNVIFATNLNIVDEQGNDVTVAVKAAVISDATSSGMHSTPTKQHSTDAER